MATKLEAKPAAARTLHEQDFAAWSSEQAALLRAMRFGELDLAHLAEEVEDLGHSERDAVRSQVRRVLEDKLSPSLRSDLETMLPRLYAQIQPKARRALRGFGEPRTLPARCPYTLDEVVRAEWLPRNQHGIADETD